MGAAARTPTSRSQALKRTRCSPTTSSSRLSPPWLEASVRGSSSRSSRAGHPNLGSETNHPTRPQVNRANGSGTNSHPFRLCDLQLFIGQQRIDPLTCSLADLNRVTFVTMTFTTQKNGVRGEIIGHSRSGHAFGCPVVSVLNWVRYLRTHDATPDTPLCTVRRPAAAGCIREG
jgi:hypothetical protein